MQKSAILKIETTKQHVSNLKMTTILRWEKYPFIHYLNYLF